MGWVFDWHGQDSRATGPLDVACTVTQTYGAGGGNAPLVVDIVCRASTQGGAESQMNTATTLTTDHDRTIIAHKNEAVALQGNIIDRDAGMNGTGVGEDVSFTLNTVDRHGVAYDTGCLTPGEAQEQRCYSADAPAPTLQSRECGGGQGKSFVQKAGENVQPKYIVRRLMPMECGRLQGFPDGWGEIEQLAADMPEETAAFWRRVYETDCAIKGKRPQKSVLEKPDKLAAWHNGLHTDSAEYKMWGNGMALPNALFFVQRAVARVAIDTGKSAANVKLGSMFDGSGTMPLCAAMCGARPVWASEVEPYPIAVTKTHLPGMKHLGSVTDICGGNIEPVDIITFGSPCQDLSIAGKRAGLDGNRSGLFREAIRIILEMLEATGWKYPRFVIWENVPGALSSNGGKDFETVLNELLRLTGTDQSIRQRGKWGGTQGTELWPTDLSMRNTGECPNADAEYTLAAILADDPPTRYFLSVRAMDGILSRASRRGKQLPELLVTAIAGMKEWWRLNPLGGYDPAYTMKIRSGCEGGGKGPLVQNDLSATLATHQDQTVFAPRAFSFDSLASNSMKSANPYSGCREVDTAKTLDCGTPDPNRNQGGIAIVQKGSADEQ